MTTEWSAESCPGWHAQCVCVIYLVYCKMWHAYVHAMHLGPWPRATLHIRGDKCIMYKHGKFPPQLQILFCQMTIDRNDVQREREKHHISSSHLGLIRCPTPVGVGVIIYAQTICDKLGNPM